MHWLKFTPRAARASICGVFTEGFSWFTPTKSARNWSAQIISTLGLREEAEAASTAPAATAALAPTAATAPEARALRRKSRRVGEVFWVQWSVMLRLLDSSAIRTLSSASGRRRIAPTRRMYSCTDETSLQSEGFQIKWTLPSEPARWHRYHTHTKHTWFNQGLRAAGY